MENTLHHLLHGWSGSLGPALSWRRWDNYLGGRAEARPVITHSGDVYSSLSSLRVGVFGGRFVMEKVMSARIGLGKSLTKSGYTSRRRELRCC